MGGTVSLFIQDPEGNGKAKEIIWRIEKDINRFDIVTLPVPPRTPVVIRVEQIEKHDRPSALPDLAVDPWDVNLSGKRLSVTVHNIGNAAAENIVVRLVDGDDTIENTVIKNLDPPVDFVPKKTTVSFIKVPESRVLRVIIDPEDAIQEILEENNEAKIEGS